MATALTDYLTTAAAAQELGVSRQQISYLCKAGVLKARKIHPRLYLITRASLAAYRHAERRKHGPYATSLKLRSPERRAKNPGKKSKPAHITIDT